jgi:5,10-methylenetetrahydrofolate reductase
MPTPFKDALASGKFVVTSEVAPPKGTNLEKFKHHIELLKDKVDAMNVTGDQPGKIQTPHRAFKRQSRCHERDRSSKFGHAISFFGRLPAGQRIGR